MKKRELCGLCGTDDYPGPKKPAKHYFVLDDGPSLDDVIHLATLSNQNAFANVSRDPKAVATCSEHVDDLRNVYRYSIYVEVEYNAWVAASVMGN